MNDSVQKIFQLIKRYSFLFIFSSFYTVNFYKIKVKISLKPIIFFYNNSLIFFSSTVFNNNLLIINKLLDEIFFHTTNN